MQREIERSEKYNNNDCEIKQNPRLPYIRDTQHVYRVNANKIP